MQDELSPFSGHGIAQDPCPCALPFLPLDFATAEIKKQVVYYIFHHLYLTSAGVIYSFHFSMHILNFLHMF